MKSIRFSAAEIEFLQNHYELELADAENYVTEIKNILKKLGVIKKEEVAKEKPVKPQGKKRGRPRKEQPAVPADAAPAAAKAEKKPAKKRAKKGSKKAKAVKPALAKQPEIAAKEPVVKKRAAKKAPKKAVKEPKKAVKKPAGKKPGRKITPKPAPAPSPAPASPEAPITE